MHSALPPLKTSLPPLARRSRHAPSCCFALALLGLGTLTARAGGFMEMIKVPAGYSVGKYEVTQAQYEAVMGKNRSQFKGPRRPVENVSWQDAMSFCKHLTDSEHKAGTLAPGLVYTLPTEAQWEYFAGGTSLEDSVTSLHTVHESTSEVGSLRPNRYGLYDVRGNVWEWCLNPFEPDSDVRVIRGGAYSNADPEKLQTGYRFGLTAIFDQKVGGIGFRCVLVPQK